MNYAKLFNKLKKYNIGGFDEKYLILFFSILIFTSCTRMAINTANSKATKNQFYQG